MSHPLCYPAHMKNKLYVHKPTIASATPILGAFQTWVVSLTPCFSKVCQPPPDPQRFQPFPSHPTRATPCRMSTGPKRPLHPVALSCTQLHPVAPSCTKTFFIH